MASPTLQQKFLSLSAVLQLLRAAVWATVGVILLVQALDPTIGASLPVLQHLGLGGAVLAAVAVGGLVNGMAQAWVGYHVSTWRKSRLLPLMVPIAAIDAVAWAELGLRLDSRGEAGWALTGFIICGLAALSAIGLVAGKSSMQGQF
ncbi:MAG: hypothetical protein JST54_22060 [Deltaproteobacteria bacterium]|nr:hypothetical protein [Deltaproteobacteria bacterium]